MTPTQDELYAEATRLDIDGRSNMDKDELAVAVLEREADNSVARTHQSYGDDDDGELSKAQRLYDDFRAGRVSTDWAIQSLLALAAGEDQDVYADEDPANQ